MSVVIINKFKLKNLLINYFEVDSRVILSMGENMDLADSNDQNKVIKAKIAIDQLISAKPGAGKTFTLIHKVSELIADPNTMSAEILVLSFTRAAVKEIKDRIKEVKTDNTELVRFVTVQTFDSFVTWILAEAGLEEVLKEPVSEDESSYDKRIDALLKRIDASETLKEGFSIYKHLLVDEAQDLVGVRADLVSKLCEVIGGGKTIFMDEAQAIFNYLQRSFGGTTFEKFLLDLKDRHNFEVIYLTHDYRTIGKDKDRLFQIKSDAREIILDSKKSGEEKYQAINELIKELQQINLDALINFIKAPPRTRVPIVAVLCRTNGQVLHVADEFIKKGVFPEIRRGQGFKSYPAWIGRLFSEYTNQFITKTEFKDIWDQKISTSSRIPELELEKSWELLKAKSWELLKTAEGQKDRSHDLDLRALKNSMNLFKVPDELLQPPLHSLVISTIHRAKGREFDAVLLVPPHTSRKDSDLAEEARIQYVGLTRPKYNLGTLTISPRNLSLLKDTERWVGYGWSNKNHRIQVGLQGDFASGSIIEKQFNFPTIAECCKTQNFLWEGIRRGDELKIRGEFPPGHAIYNITHRETGLKLGLLSKSFTADLRTFKKSIKNGPNLMPLFINNVIVDNIVTEVSPISNLLKYHHPYTTSGFWLGIRVHGLARLYFKA